MGRDVSQSMAMPNMMARVPCCGGDSGREGCWMDEAVEGEEWGGRSEKMMMMG